MDTIVAITTPKGVAAISSIELFGSRAAEIIKKVFESNRNNNCEFVKGQVYTGRIFTDNQTVDHVVLGVLDTNGFEINCHGNPLIVEKIINLLVDLGASPVSAETLFLAKLRTDKLLNFIQVESSTAKLKAVTPKGIELITNQPEIGLGKSTAEWLNNIAPNNLDEIKCQCHQILETSKNAKYLIEPVKAVITGAPNAGKSTLLNALAGKEKAIVTNVAGTTRDWVSTTLKLKGMLIEFIDTAGINRSLVDNDPTDADSQNKTHGLISEADLVLFVIDGSKEIIPENIKLPADKKTIIVYNKSDLDFVKNVEINAGVVVAISAKSLTNIDALLDAVVQIFAVETIKTTDAVCFTTRQIRLVQNIIAADNIDSAKSSISQLLTGSLSV